MPTTQTQPTPEEMQTMCPARWTNLSNHDLKPDWEKCIKLGQNFDQCPHWTSKENCWAKWFDERRQGTMSAPDLEATETPRGAQAKRIMAAYDQLEVARTQATIDEDGQTLSMLRVTMDTLHSYARFMVDVQHDPALKS